MLVVFTSRLRAVACSTQNEMEHRTQVSRRVHIRALVVCGVIEAHAHAGTQAHHARCNHLCVKLRLDYGGSLLAYTSVEMWGVVDGTAHNR